jgi:hypothetical protein
VQKNLIKKHIHNRETPEDSDTKYCECWENYLQKTKVGDWIECASCRNWLHEFCSPYNDKCFDCGRKFCERKREDAEEDVEYFVHYNLVSCVHWVEVLCIGDIFAILMLMLLLYFE